MALLKEARVFFLGFYYKNSHFHANNRITNKNSFVSNLIKCKNG